MSSRTFCSTAVSEHNSLQMIALCIYLLLLGLCLSGGKAWGLMEKKKKKKPLVGKVLTLSKTLCVTQRFPGCCWQICHIPGLCHDSCITRS